jgi:hypothetical protein
VSVTRRSFAMTIAGGSIVAAAKKKSQAKGPEIELLDHSAKIEEARINLDGRVKNLADHPVRKLTVVYEILDSDKNVLTRQKGPIDEEELPQGEEAGFSSQITYVARSVYYRFEFEDGSERELRSENTGPFAI